jgi:hypothetical protein
MAFALFSCDTLHQCRVAGVRDGDGCTDVLDDERKARPGVPRIKRDESCSTKEHRELQGNSVRRRPDAERDEVPGRHAKLCL